MEDERISFEGISACSAGAMNAVVLAYGLTVGGREGAKLALENFWRRISHSALFSPLQPSPYDRLVHNHSMENSPAFLMLSSDEKKTRMLKNTISPNALAVMLLRSRVLRKELENQGSGDPRHLEDRRSEIHQRNDLFYPCCRNPWPGN